MICKDDCAWLHHSTKTADIKTVILLVDITCQHIDSLAMCCIHLFDICCFSAVMQPQSSLEIVLNCEVFYINFIYSAVCGQWIRRQAAQHLSNSESVVWLIGGQQWQLFQRRATPRNAMRACSSRRLPACSSVRISSFESHVTCPATCRATRTPDTDSGAASHWESRLRAPDTPLRVE